MRYPPCWKAANWMWASINSATSAVATPVEMGTAVRCGVAAASVFISEIEQPVDGENRLEDEEQQCEQRWHHHLRTPPRLAAGGAVKEWYQYEQRGPDPRHHKDADRYHPGLRELHQELVQGQEEPLRGGD